jgi:hypothetical protein
MFKYFNNLFLQKIILAFIFAGFLGCTPTDDFLAKVVKEHSSLIDPTSPIFRDITESKDAWCGEINVKNRMGGYVGWHAFHIVRHADGDVYVSLADSELSKALHEIYCASSKPVGNYVAMWESI